MLIVSGAIGLPAVALAVTLSVARADRIRPAAPSNGIPQVGALYPNARSAAHGCTASVVHSRSGNTLITAAHCVIGDGRGMVFVPGQRGARTPYGRWTVTAAYLEPGWRSSSDPHADVAFLTVAARMIRGHRTEIEQVTGAYGLGSTPGRGQRVAVTGYPAGTANAPVTCRTKVYITSGFPSFDCRGFVGGTSGSPWVRVTRRGPQIVGVIGGLNQGGCHDYTSYSSPLAGQAAAAYRRASAGARPADVAPPLRGDGC